MSDRTIVITSASGVVINTTNYKLAEQFYNDGAKVEYDDNGLGVFASYPNVIGVGDPKPVYPVWLSEVEKNRLIAHWEKTGMFGSVIDKIRATENTKRTK